ncbi:MAG: Type 1 glutamine amidotransferase-like domain-containing protein [Candidatus Saccharimonadales bacterium]
MNLALFGSGEFTPSVDGIDEYLISTFKPHNIAVLPTAAGAEKDALKWIEMARQHYAKFHLTVIPVPIFNKEDSNNKDLTDLLIPAEWIFFSGGDPGYLMDVLNDSLLWKTVLKRLQTGALLTGSSAGAMVMGNFVLASPFRAMFSNSDTVWQKAFGLVDYTVFPHFNRLKKHKKILQRITQKGPEKISSAWLGIDENTAFVISLDKKTVQGEGKVEIHKSSEEGYL